eukprot:4291024-Amphidinium_carterae.1
MMRRMLSEHLWRMMRRVLENDEARVVVEEDAVEDTVDVVAVWSHLDSIGLASEVLVADYTDMELEHPPGQSDHWPLCVT